MCGIKALDPITIIKNNNSKSIQISQEQDVVGIQLQAQNSQQTNSSVVAPRSPMQNHKEKCPPFVVWMFQFTFFSCNY